LIRAKQTAEAIQKSMLNYREKDIKIIVDDKLADND
jgi:hypothetical protein